MAEPQSAAVDPERTINKHLIDIERYVHQCGIMADGILERTRGTEPPSIDTTEKPEVDAGPDYLSRCIRLVAQLESVVIKLEQLGGYL